MLAPLGLKHIRTSISDDEDSGIEMDKGASAPIPKKKEAKWDDVKKPQAKPSDNASLGFAQFG